MDAFDTVIQDINIEFGAELYMATGQAPVQVMGDIGERFAYFRYRGARYSLEIAPTEEDLFDEDMTIFKTAGDFGEAHQGWLEPDDLKRLLTDCLNTYRRMKAMVNNDD